MTEKTNSNLINTALIALIVGVLGFFGGVQYQKLKAPAFPQGQLQRGGMMQGGTQAQGQHFGGNGGSRMMGGRGVLGEVVNKDATSMTVKLQDGSTKIVVLSAATKYNKTSSGSAADVTVGTNVMVLGNTNTDGSTTAETVQINPQFGEFGPRPSGTPAPTQAP